MNKLKRKLALAGAGSLNRRIAQLWQQQHGPVEAMRLSEPDPGLGFPQVSVDLSCDPWPDLQAGCLVVALASRGERTLDNYRRAYVEPLRQLQESLADWSVTPDRIVVVSSSRVYGADDGRWIDDDTQAQTTDERGQILLQMESLAHQLPGSVSVARLSGIYGPGRDWLRRSALAAENESYDDRWTNRIHIDDAAAAIVHLLQQEQPAPHYLVSDRQPQTLTAMYNYFRRPAGLRALNGEESPARGKRLQPTRLIDSGFEWRYPDAFSGGYQV